jgi:tetrapyrrole methylase family protein/MazG family protein
VRDSASGQSRLAVIGLGPAGLDRLRPTELQLLMDPARTALLRTIQHPAASELAARRPVVVCDDLYDTEGAFERVYVAIAERVVRTAEAGPAVFAVPGSAVVGERAVAAVLETAAAAGVDVEVRPGESFLDLAFVRAGIDPIRDGVQVLDGRALPDPLSLHLPTLITQVDSPLVAGDVAITLGRLLTDEAIVTVLDRLGDADERIVTTPLRDLSRIDPGPRTTLFLEPATVGWHGLVTTNRVLRVECPWDRAQTHHSLLRHLIEETYETVEAVSALPESAPAGPVDFGAYALLEEELGDLLLQVVFHAGLAAEAGAFDVDEVAEQIRRKLVRRHPHVFGDVEVSGAGEVLANWEVLKSEEKSRESLMDDIPTALPGIARADKIQRRAATIGFDWAEVDPVLAKVEEELGELRAAGEETRTDELGDLLFAVVNLARHLDVDPEIALARASDTFIARFRMMERLATGREIALASLDLAAMDALWDEAKERIRAG